MKHSWIILVVLATFLLAAGCAQASKASAEDTAIALTFEAPADRGVVYLYRPGRAVGAALVAQVQVNGQPAGGTSPGSFFRWELKPGVYTFFSSTDESSATEALTVEAGQLYFIEQNSRLGLTQGGRVTLSQVSVGTGKSRVQGLKMLVSAYLPD